MEDNVSDFEFERLKRDPWALQSIGEQQKMLMRTVEAFAQKLAELGQTSLVCSVPVDGKAYKITVEVEKSL
jgi:hypothetical protein